MIREVVYVMVTPPRLTIRALDDLHRIAVSVERTTRLLEGVEPKDVRAALDTMQSFTVVVRQLEQVERRLTTTESLVLKQAEIVERQLSGVLDVAARLERALPAPDDLLDGIGQLATAARTLANVTEPFQAAVDRLTRLTDRLPGVPGIRSNG